MAISSYSVTHISSNATTTKAIIELFSYTPTGEVYEGRLTFKENGTPLPVNSWEGSFKIAYFHISDFSDIINTLRYEKPLLVYYYSSQSVLISSGREPIGEQEL